MNKRYSMLKEAVKTYTTTDLRGWITLARSGGLDSSFSALLITLHSFSKILALTKRLRVCKRNVA